MRCDACRLNKLDANTSRQTSEGAYDGNENWVRVPTYNGDMDVNYFAVQLESHNSCQTQANRISDNLDISYEGLENPLPLLNAIKRVKLQILLLHYEGRNIHCKTEAHHLGTKC